MINLKELPNDVDALKNIIENIDGEHRKEKTALENKIDILMEEIELWKKRMFGPKSERFQEDDQDLLFDEAEMGACEIADENSYDSVGKSDTVEIPSYKRKKKGRKKLPQSLPRKIIDVEIDESDRYCAAGKERKFIKWEITEKLDIKPPQVRVIQTRRAVYGCPDTICVLCEDEEKGCVRTAPMPAQLMDKSILTPGLAAFLIASKYCDHLPFYRQQGIYKRYGVDISRQSMCRWTIKLYEKLAGFLKLFRQELLSGPLIGIDETTLQVLSELKRLAQTKSYLWVFRGGDPASPTVLFMYRPTRSGDFLSDYLESYEGVIQSDGYQAYDSLATKDTITLVVCWAHVRRKFDEAAKASKNRGSANEALSKIQQLYSIERKIKDKPPEEKLQIRQEESIPLLEKIKEWLDKKKKQVLPKSLLGKAVNYTLNLWPKLIRYTENGIIPIDNNAVENALRPECLEKKNWLFSYATSGANASAFFYSLIETAKANKLDPYWYLRYLFEQIKNGVILEKLWTLMPQHVDKNIIREYSMPGAWG